MPDWHRLRRIVTGSTHDRHNPRRVDTTPNESRAAAQGRQSSCCFSLCLLLFPFVSVSTVLMLVWRVSSWRHVEINGEHGHKRIERTQTETTNCYFFGGIVRVHLFVSVHSVSVAVPRGSRPATPTPSGYRTTKSPRSRMSFDDEPISTRNVPSSTIQCISRSSICNCSRPTEKTTSRVSPGARWIR